MVEKDREAKREAKRAWLAEHRARVTVRISEWRAQNREYEQAQREQKAAQMRGSWKAAQQRAWKAAHPEQVRASAKRYRAAHLERDRAYQAAWRKAKPYMVAARNRKGEVGSACPPWADLAAIRAFYEEATRLTKVTGIRHEVDHIVPLNHDLVSGLHVPWNLQILTKADNRKKGNTLPVSV